MNYEITEYDDDSYSFIAFVDELQFRFDCNNGDNEPEEIFLVDNNNSVFMFNDVLDQMKIIVDGELLSIRQIFDRNNLKVDDEVIESRLKDMAEQSNWNNHIKSFA